MAGPRIDVESIPGVSVEVSRAYQGQRKSPQVWSGMVTILYVHQPFQDIEVTLVDGREGRFVALPQRQYGDENDRKYKKLVYLHNPSVLTAMKEAIEASMKSPAADEEDDRPF